MNKAELEKFLLEARAQTYAAATGKTKAALNGSTQYEYSQDGWLYRDVYYLGNGIFPGLETVFYKTEPVWSMSYYGNFSGMTEEQVDKMLRKALIDNAETTRMYNSIEKDYGDFKYTCSGSGSIDELDGSEELYIGKKRVYFFYYAGGYIGS